MGLEAPAVHLLLVIPVLLVILALAPPSRRSIVPAAHFFEGEDLLVDPDDDGGGRSVEVEDHVVSLDGEELGVMGGRTAQSILLENRWGRESMSYESYTKHTHHKFRR